MPLQAWEVDEDTVSFIERALLAEIDEIAGLQAISPADVESDLRSFHLSVDACDRELACLARAGRYSRAHLAIEVRASALGGVPTVSMRLIDTQTANEVGRVAEPLNADLKARAQQIHRLSLQLMQPETYVGDLSLSCPTLGAEVYLDDKLLGTTPLPAQRNLPAGLHVLRVSKAGYSDINRFVDVVFNRASTVQVDFNNASIAGVIVERVSASGFGELNLLSTEPGLEVRIDGEPVGVTPLKAAITKVAAGMRHVTLRRPGQPPIVQDLEVKQGMRLDAIVKGGAKGLEVSSVRQVPPGTPLPSIDELLHPAAPAPEVVAKRLTWRLWTGVGLLGGGVVAASVGTVFARQVKAYSEEARGIAGDPEMANWDADVRASKEARLATLNKIGPRAQQRQLISYGAAGVLGATGLGFVLWDIFGSEPPSVAAGSVAWGAQPTTGGMRLWARTAW